MFGFEKRSYVILSNDPEKGDVEVPGTLDKAQAKADKIAECTQKDIVIMLKERVASRRRWHAGAYDAAANPQKNPIIFEGVGYYSDWE